MRGRHLQPELTYAGQPHRLVLPHAAERRNADRPRASRLETHGESYRMKQPIPFHPMLTRRHFLKKAGYGLVLVGGTRALIADADLPGDPKGVPGPRAGATPAWLRGVPLNQWHSVPGTELSASTDLPAQIAAGLTNAAFRNIGFGDPRRGIFDFSGGALKSDGSEMLAFGGGGAGAWAGNDVRGLRLESDKPAWRTLVNPAPASAVWKKGDPTTPYMKDGTPNARHSYAHQNFIDATNTFMTFRCLSVWPGDQGHFGTVDSVPFSTGAWNPQGTHPDVPENVGAVWANWVIKHPITEQVYVSSSQKIYSFDYATNTWHLFTTPRATMNYGCVAIDPTRNIIFRIGVKGTSLNIPGTIDLTTGIYTEAEFSGPQASAILLAQYDAPGLVYDSGLDAFLYFQDDGYLYKMAYLTAASYYVERLTLIGTPPAVLASGRHNGGHIAIYTRMQYVPRLRGVCIIQGHNRPAYFVRTG